MKHSTVSAFLLAGGKSSRMGQDKGLMFIHGKQLAAKILDILQSVFEHVYIVANNPDYQQFGYPVLADIIPEKGALGGIYTALSHTKTVQNFLLSVDMPFISEKAIRYLLSQHTENQLYAAQNTDRKQPLFALYPTFLLQEIEKNIAQNDLKLIHFIEKNPHQWLDFRSFEEKEPLLFFNMNTLEDFIYIKKMAQTIHIQAFGKLTDIVGKNPFEMQGIANTADLLQKLATDFPLLAKHSFKIAVNQAFVAGDFPLQHGDKIALMPPFSGG